MILQEKMKIISVLIISMLFFIAFNISCCAEELPEKKDEKISLILTILPQLEFAEKIGDGFVDTEVLIPPGASPHTYEPKPSQLVKVSEADIYAIVGSGIEFELAWSEKIISLNQDMLVIDCSSNIELIGADRDEKNTDPHIWLSLVNAKIMAENICRGICQIDPERADLYRKNLADYQAEIDKIDGEISGILKDRKIDKIMVLHPAWTYFARDYALEQIAIEVEGKEPTPMSMQKIIREAKENDIDVIFASPEFSDKSAQAVAEEIGAAVVKISPLEADYLENMEKVARAFAESIK